MKIHHHRLLGSAVALVLGATALSHLANAASLLVEAESFAQKGGWVLDTQFINEMGSPYLMAHGLGEPVRNAETPLTLPETGTWHVWVRTKDWTARWKAEGNPGRFDVLIDGTRLANTLGTEGADWHWQKAGSFSATTKNPTLALHDLTGFNGRCDAVFLSTDANPTLPDKGDELRAWRRSVRGLSGATRDAGSFDLVVIGGGYGGTAAAISAARMGCSVALVQDRPVLGGNGSSEVRVWAKGGTRRGLYPELGGIVDEFSDYAKSSPGTKEEFGDDTKEKIVRAETKITLLLNHSVHTVEKAGTSQIKSVIASDTRSGEDVRITGRLFCDATGHAAIGFLAGADHTIREKEHLGMSNMWRWTESDQPQAFPSVPWALPLSMDDFPYPRRFHAEWFWESGFDKHPILELESTRDWNFRAIFGAWNAMKNGAEKDKHANAKLEWVAYIGGTRESRQLLGDVILNREDIVEKKAFPDGTVPTTWDIDLHYPKEQYAAKFPTDPFISKAVFDRSVDRQHGYPVPYRCFYSRNIDNLFMAGRCVSVTHEALGTVRVMKTGGMIGEVVGKAASLCVKHQATPRGVYDRYLPELLSLLKQPAAARRNTVSEEPTLPAGWKPVPPAQETAHSSDGIKMATLPGIVLDNTNATFSGTWGQGATHELLPFVGNNYAYAPGKDGKHTATYTFTIPKAGKYEVRMSFSPHENRSPNTPVNVQHATGNQEFVVNQRSKPTLPNNFHSLGVFEFAPGKPASVVIGGKPASGNLHADAVQLLPQ